jgi:DNA-binding PadR family transcriptional regulator
LSFEIQELPDIIRVIVLLNLSRGIALEKPLLKRRIDKYCAGHVCVEISDIDKALKEMSDEGLLTDENGTIKLTERGLQLGQEWQSLLLKKEPILEVVAGLTDGSITGLVVVLSAFLAGLATNMATFTAVLSLSAVAITNFSSFLMGGKTEDIADLLTLKTLMDYSLSDIPDKIERDKSLRLVKQLFILLHGEIGKSNLYAAIICGTTTFLAGIIPIIAYLILPKPLDIILSLSIVCVIVGIFLVRYRSKRAKVHWQITLTETVIIIAIAVIASLIIGGM